MNALVFSGIQGCSMNHLMTQNSIGSADWIEGDGVPTHRFSLSESATA